MTVLPNLGNIFQLLLKNVLLQLQGECLIRIRLKVFHVGLKTI